MGMDYGGRAKVKHDTWPRRFDKWASSQSGKCITRKLSEDELIEMLGEKEDKMKESNKSQSKTVKEEGTKIEVFFSHVVYKKGYLIIPKNVLVCNMNEYIKQNLGNVEIRDSSITDEHISHISLIVNENSQDVK